jgi:host factor-I protein
MLRLTREGKPNLFIYKHQIRTITEVGSRTRTPRRAVPAAIQPEENGPAAEEATS